MYALAPGLLLGMAGFVLYYFLDTSVSRFFAALLFLAGVSSGGGDYWFVVKALKYPAASLMLDNGTEVEVFDGLVD